MEKIRQLRQKRGWSQEKLGFMLDVSMDTISRWENGRREPKWSDILRLAALFECEPMDLGKPASRKKLRRKDSTQSVTLDRNS